MRVFVAVSCANAGGHKSYFGVTKNRPKTMALIHAEAAADAAAATADTTAATRPRPSAVCESFCRHTHTNAHNMYANIRKICAMRGMAWRCSVANVNCHNNIFTGRDKCEMITDTHTHTHVQMAIYQFAACVVYHFTSCHTCASAHIHLPQLLARCRATTMISGAHTHTHTLAAQMINK